MKRYLLEPLLQRLRINKVKPYIPLGGVLVDIGCDEPPALIDLLKNKMKRCVGVDVVATARRYENVEIKRMKIDKTIDLTAKSADVITMLAVLEHLKFPQEIVGECYRILKPGGKLLITVPSPQNEPLLELLARIHLVRPEMIEQHENYFTHEALKQLLQKAGFFKVQVEGFELGFNTFAKAVK